MMRGICAVLTYISVIFFPWPLTALLVLGGALLIPSLPLSAGIFFDTLYYAYTPHAGTLPLYTLYGAILTIIAFLVRRRLNTSIIGE